MITRKIKRTELQMIIDDCETPRDYFYRIYEAKQSGAEWAVGIPCDSIVYFADTGDMEKLITMLKL